MELTEQERERIVKEELMRSQLREEISFRRRPRITLLAILWAGILTLLAGISPHVHDWFAPK